MNIVYADIERVDISNSLAKVKFVSSLEDIKRAEDETYIVPINELTTETISGASIYHPYINQKLVEGNYLYFDLENHAFYQKAKVLIKKGDTSKGVFRYRRIVREEDYSSFVIGDLYVLSSLFGEAIDLQVKRTDFTSTPTHTVLTFNFGGGTMAHIEFTVGSEDRIELEWSGIKRILEFDSGQMQPIQPSKTPITYTVDSILETAHLVDRALISHLERIKALIYGGDLS